MGGGVNRSRSCGGARNLSVTGVESAVMEEVGGEEGNVVGGEGGDGIVDEVFENVEMVVSGEGGEGGAGEGAEVPVNVSGGEGAISGVNVESGASVSPSGGVGVSPIPLIPRRRLRDILDHAQGECIMCYW